MTKEKIDAKKVAAALVCGWLGLLLSRYAVVIDTIYNIKFVWSFILPVMVAYSWRPVYAYITAFGGLGALYPFIVSPLYGWANVYTAAAMAVFLIMLGYTGEKNGHRNAGYIFVPLFCMFFFCIGIEAYPALLAKNPEGLKRFVSPTILRVEIMSVCLSLCLQSLLCKVLLEMPAFRRIMRKEPLEYAEKNLGVLLNCAAVAVMFLLVDRLADSYFFSSRGTHSSIIASSFGSVTKLTLVMLVMLIVCDVLIQSMMQSECSRTELEKSEENYRTMFDNLSDAHFEITRSGHIRHSSRAVAKVFGYFTDEAEKMNVADFFENKSDGERLVERLFEYGRIENIELNGRKKKGGRCNLLVSGNVIKIPLSGAELGMLNLKDLTGYKQSEESRFNLAAMNNAVLESTKDCIWTIDVEKFCVSTYNTAFAEKCKSRGKIIYEGMPVDRLYGTKECERLRRYSAAALKYGEFSTELEFSDDTIFRMSFYPVKLQDGRSMISIFASDITHQKQAEETIIELNEGLEEMVKRQSEELKKAQDEYEFYGHVLTHEIKTPLREISSYVDFVMNDSAGRLAEQSVSDLSVVKKVCAESLDMADKMMSYSKAGYAVLDIERVSLYDLVMECYGEAAFVSGKKRINIELYDLPVIYTDRTLFKVAVTNLFSNSIKFSRVRESVDIFVGCMISDEECTIYFKDCGVGFSPQNTEDLFGLFSRAHNGSEYEGSGVGLALVRRIAKRSGAQVDIYGEKDNGCVVFMTFARNRVSFQ